MCSGDKSLLMKHMEWVFDVCAGLDLIHSNTSAVMHQCPNSGTCLLWPLYRTLSV
jgi:hypothetical protein